MPRLSSLPKPIVDSLKDPPLISVHYRLHASMLVCCLAAPHRYHRTTTAVATACCIVRFRGRTCVARCGTTRPSSSRSTLTSPSSTSGRWACAHCGMHHIQDTYTWHAPYKGHVNMACTMQHAAHTWKHAASTRHATCSMQHTRGISVAADDRSITHCLPRITGLCQRRRVCRIYKPLHAILSERCTLCSGRDSIAAARCLLHVTCYAHVVDVACCICTSPCCMMCAAWRTLRSMPGVDVRAPHRIVPFRRRRRRHRAPTRKQTDRSLLTATTMTPHASWNQQTSKRTDTLRCSRVDRFGCCICFGCFHCLGVRPDYGVRPRNGDGAA